jgi:hypothetical protein
MGKTRGYIEAEEKRMKDVLESIHYNIDTPSTVFLITGPGRIEKVGSNSTTLYVLGC